MSFSRLKYLSVPSLLFIISGCASGTFKARQEQREQLATSTGMFCEFISGDLFPDLDVELSLRMAKRCDSDKNFSITNHRNESGQNGVMYCCAVANASAAKHRKPPRPPAPPMTPASAPAKESKENKEIAKPAIKEDNDDDLSN